MSLPKEILEEFWGYKTFRAPQEKIITAVLEKKDVIALLPTGGGKSLCFQIPALINEGICLVISPLIALMEDQVSNLKKRSIKATLIPSGIDQNEQIQLFDTIKFGNYKFLYISPERLQSKFIQQKIKELNVNLIAVDEAHCISEWGHDFRPSYRNIAILKTIHPHVNFIALTATANNNVLKDIKQSLTLKDTFIFKKSFFRENLAYQVFKIEDKLERILQIFKKKNRIAIIYVNSRKKTEEISNFLNAHSFKSTYYHAGLTVAEKKEHFKNWILEKTPIIVATNAFGMGIDKANVGIVIHFNLPESIENYIQETGRAGRDSNKSFGVLLYNETDILRHTEQTNNTLPSLSEIKEVHAKLYQYFTIARGEFIETVFDFNFLGFCEKYNFKVLKTSVILKILSNYGVIEITHNYQKKSTLQITASHTTILKFGKRHQTFQPFLNVILRTYGGLFENETKINEFNIAKKASITSTQVTKNLKLLETQNLVIYKPVIAESSLSFLGPREDDITIHRFSKEIKQFLNQKRKKADDFIHFIKNNSTCRSIQLLGYFDEKSTKKCGICDVCLQNKSSKNTDHTTTITSILKEHKQLSSREISNIIETSENNILMQLQELIAKGVLEMSLQNKFQLKK